MISICKVCLNAERTSEQSSRKTRITHFALPGMTGDSHSRRAVGAAD